MPVSTTVSALGINPQTNAVINYMNGGRTPEQVIGEFYGLRKEAIYDDAGETVIDMINDFRDDKVLAEKGVKYNAILASRGVTEEKFNLITNDYGKRNNSTSNGATKEDTTVSDTSGGAKKSTKTAR